ncbi:MAG TPA: OpgC domain-containing protein [Bryobacteraceae bacterium]|nr:OpgC domain-containing protein [Bryobacteraceae bacterium]
MDVLRGFLLLGMTLTHLPTKAAIISNQTFGFVSDAEGFIFLAAFLVGQIEQRTHQHWGESRVMRDLLRRTWRIYFYHCALLAVAFTLVAEMALRFHLLALENLLSFYLQSPRQALIAAALLEYRPSLLDILPMYIVFMLLTPIARRVARSLGWKTVLFVSFIVWVEAQFGLRAWLYRHSALLGLHVPENSTGAFDLYGSQLLWMIGLALGSIYAERLSAVPNAANSDLRIPSWIVKLSWMLAATFLVLRYAPADHWMDAQHYGWLIDKWHLGAFPPDQLRSDCIAFGSFWSADSSLTILQATCSTRPSVNSGILGSRVILHCRSSAQQRSQPRAAGLAAGPFSKRNHFSPLHNRSLAKKTLAQERLGLLFATTR